MPTVILNGEERSLPDGATVADAVRASGAAGADGTRGSGRGLAVAVDGEVVPRGEWRSAPLAAGARVEVLQAVQGGC